MRADHDDFRLGPGRSDRHSRQSDDRVIAQGGHGFRHVAGALDGPFVILFQKDSLDEPDDCRLGGKDADDIGAAFDLAVEPFEAVGGSAASTNARRESPYRRGRRPRPRP